jgi:hypothetical protein
LCTTAKFAVDWQLWVIFVRSTPLPTLSACPLRSDRVRTIAPQRFDPVCTGALFNHLVGAAKQCDRECEAERLCGLEVDLLISAVLRGKLPSLAMSDGHDQSATLTI